MWFAERRNERGRVGGEVLREVGRGRGGEEGGVLLDLMEGGEGCWVFAVVSKPYHRGPTWRALSIAQGGIFR